MPAGKKRPIYERLTEAVERMWRRKAKKKFFHGFWLSCGALEETANYIDTMRSELINLKSRFEMQKSRINADDKEIERLKTLHGALHKRVEDQQAQLRDEMRESQRLQGKIKEETAGIQLLNDRLAVADGVITDLREELGMVKAELSTVDAARLKAIDERGAAESELLQRNARVHELEVAHREGLKLAAQDRAALSRSHFWSWLWFAFTIILTALLAALHLK